MIKFLQNLPNFIKIIYIVSKFQILTNHGKKELPFFAKTLATIVGLIFYPKSLFVAPSLSFGQRLAGMFQTLGPIYIKFGQTLSTRQDLIGQEIAQDLRYLQDKLPAFDIEIVKNQIENSFSRKISDLFLEFDEKPYAAASIAQVHKAKLKTGEIVAVKVLRPNIAAIYEKDIKFLDYTAELITFLLPKAKRLKLKEVISVFRQSMQMELDLQMEAAAASNIYDNFINDHSLYIPRIYWHITCREIMTLEWVEGVSIYEAQKIINYGLQPSEIAAKIAVIFFNQAFRDGFFHADLHPGNILVSKEGKIILLDFGIVGILSEGDKLAIAEILYGFLNRDYRLVAKVHKRAKYIPLNTNLDYFAQSCRAIAEPIMGLAIKDISIGKLLTQLFKVTQEYGMETQPQLLLLQKTMVVVEGIGQSLDNNVNMWQLAEPWIKKWAAKNLSPEAKLLRILKKITDEFL